MKNALDNAKEALSILNHSEVVHHTEIRFHRILLTAAELDTVHDRLRDIVNELKSRDYPGEEYEELTETVYIKKS